ncbi:MAG: hypothetical protein ABSD80_12810 [Caulobacteraceae bacterium]|jgi:hypothetical protein
MTAEANESIDLPRRRLFGAAAVSIAGLQVAAGVARGQTAGTATAPPWRPNPTSFGELKHSSCRWTALEGLVFALSPLCAG